MIHAARRRHRAAVTVLAVVLPLGFAAGLLLRDPLPEAESLPDAFLPAPLAPATVVLEGGDLWPGLAIHTRVARDAGSGCPVVQLTPREDPRLPDLLVYWTEDDGSLSGGLPSSSLLVGRLAGARTVRLDLPQEALRGGGRLILYSLAHEEVVGASARLGPERWPWP